MPIPVEISKAIQTALAQPSWGKSESRRYQAEYMKWVDPKWEYRCMCSNAERQGLRAAWALALSNETPTS